MIYNTNKKGGEVLASGGFGCIFGPSLQCDINDEFKNTNDNGLSKLMIKKNAESEYRHIQNFKSLLHKVPNYNQYFLLDNFSICKPNKLTKSDLTGFKKCKALIKRGYTQKNINNSLDDLLVMNMPNGGINAEEFVNKYFTKNNILHLNNSLVDLLINGIVPMNNLRVYHCDIKDSNVLVDKTFQTRLIDWGLSLYYPEPLTDAVPQSLYRRPFQYNVPFSNILFNGDFINLYDDYLIKNSNPNYYSIREFVVNYIFVWNEIRGSGHLEAINDIVRQFTEEELVSIEKKKVKEHMIEYDFTYYYIIEYISKILHKYTVEGHIAIFDYLNNIFIKNIDIWGFTMIYVAIYEKIRKSSIADNYKKYTDKIKQIIQTHLFAEPNKVIDVNLLVNDLTKLNDILEDIDEPIFSELGGKLIKNKISKINKINKGYKKTNKNQIKKQNANTRRNRNRNKRYKTIKTKL